MNGLQRWVPHTQEEAVTPESAADKRELPVEAQTPATRTFGLGLRLAAPRAQRTDGISACCIKPQPDVDFFRWSLGLQTTQATLHPQYIQFLALPIPVYLNNSHSAPMHDLLHFNHNNPIGYISFHPPTRPPS